MHSDGEMRRNFDKMNRNFNVCKIIQMNQLDATMIYWSIRSAQYVSGNILPIIRSVRLRYLQHMVSCCGGEGAGERQRGTMCHVVMCPVCRMLQHPANRTHKPQLHTRPTTWKPQHQTPQAATTV